MEFLPRRMTPVVAPLLPRQRTLLGAGGMSGLVPEAVTSTAAAVAASRYLPFAILAPDFKGTNFI